MRKAGREMNAQIIHAASAAEIDEVRRLFKEYAASLNFSLCFQGFDHELESLPGDCAPPLGALLLATVSGCPAGCAALRRTDSQTGELKRLYVCPEFRGQGLGRKLTAAIIESARKAGYRRLRLDTLESMDKAQALYRSMGFCLIEPHRINPAGVGDAVCMELVLI